MATLAQAVIRRAARKHGSWKCERCGSTEDLQPFNINGNLSDYSPDNIEVLCTRCYIDWERFLRKEWLAHH